MKTMPRLTALAAFFFTALPLVRAQYAPPPPARPFPGFANEKLRADNVYMSAWDIGASERLRFEDKLGAAQTPHHHPDDPSHGHGHGHVIAR